MVFCSKMVHVLSASSIPFPQNVEAKRWVSLRPEAPGDVLPACHENGVTLKKP